MRSVLDLVSDEMRPELERRLAASKQTKAMLVRRACQGMTERQLSRRSGLSEADIKRIESSDDKDVSELEFRMYEEGLR